MAEQSTRLIFMRSKQKIRANNCRKFALNSPLEREVRLPICSHNREKLPAQKPGWIFCIWLLSAILNSPSLFKEITYSLLPIPDCFPVADCTRFVCLLLTRVNYFWLPRLFMLFSPWNQNRPLALIKTLPCTTGSSRFGAGGCPCALQNSSFQFSPESSVAFCSLQREKVYLRHFYPTGLLAFCMALLYIRSSTLGTMSSSLVVTFF